MTKSAVIFFHKNIDSICCPKWITDCVNSVMTQSYQDFDIFEIDYGATNHSVVDHRHVNGNGKKYFYYSEELHDHSQAMMFLLNKCFSMGYDVVFNTNMDDIYHPDRFQKQLAEVDNGNQLISSYWYYINEENEIVNHIDQNILFAKYPHHDDYPLDIILSELDNDMNVINHSNVCFTRSFWESFDKYGNRLRYRDDRPYEDLTLWRRAAENGIKMKIIPEYLIYYRIHSKSIGSDKKEGKYDHIKPDRTTRRAGIVLFCLDYQFAGCVGLIRHINSLLPQSLQRKFYLFTNSTEKMEIDGIDTVTLNQPHYCNPNKKFTYFLENRENFIHQTDMLLWIDFSSLLHMNFSTEHYPSSRSKHVLFEDNAGSITNKIIFSLTEDFFAVQDNSFEEFQFENKVVKYNVTSQESQMRHMTVSINHDDSLFIGLAKICILLSYAQKHEFEAVLPEINHESFSYFPNILSTQCEFTDRKFGEELISGDVRLCVDTENIYNVDNYNRDVINKHFLPTSASNSELQFIRTTFGDTPLVAVDYLEQNDERYNLSPNYYKKAFEEIGIDKIFVVSAENEQLLNDLRNEPVFRSLRNVYYTKNRELFKYCDEFILSNVHNVSTIHALATSTPLVSYYPSIGTNNKIFPESWKAIDDLDVGLSFIIRAKNEIKNMETLFESFGDLIADPSMEFIFVDNNSTDGSINISNFHAARHPTRVKVYKYNIDVAKCGREHRENINTNRTVAKYYNWCMRKATKRNIIKWDADFSATPELANMISELNIRNRTDRTYVWCTGTTVFIRDNNHIYEKRNSYYDEFRLFSKYDMFHWENSADGSAETPCLKYCSKLPQQPHIMYAHKNFEKFTEDNELTNPDEFVKLIEDDPDYSYLSENLARSPDENKPFILVDKNIITHNWRVVNGISFLPGYKEIWEAPVFMEMKRIDVDEFAGRSSMLDQRDHEDHQILEMLKNGHIHENIVKQNIMTSYDQRISRKLIVTMTEIGRMGRLCNQLFQMALLTNMAKKHNLQVVVPLNKSDNDCLNFYLDDYMDFELMGVETCEPQRLTPYKMIELKEKYFCHQDIDTEFMDSIQKMHQTDTRVVNLKGYFQSYKYFVDGAEFAFKNEYTDHAKQYVQRLRDEFNLPVVSLHIRRGDIVPEQIGRVVGAGQIGDVPPHPMLTQYYIDNACDYIEGKVGPFTLVVFSDNEKEIEACKKRYNFNNAENVTFSVGNTAIQDVLIISECDHNIMSSSSFSWWGSYLNQNDEKTVIYPNHWFNPLHSLSSENIDDLCPSTWIRMNLSSDSDSVDEKNPEEIRVSTKEDEVVTEEPVEIVSEEPVKVEIVTEEPVEVEVEIVTEEPFEVEVETKVVVEDEKSLVVVDESEVLTEIENIIAKMGQSTKVFETNKTETINKTKKRRRKKKKKSA